MSTGAFILLFLKRKWVLLSLCVVTLTGFSFKSYSGPGAWWFNDYGAGVFYEVFWCLVIFFLLPKKKHTTHIAASVFVVTCLLEILQLWQPPFLEQLRSTFLGAALLGTTFVWWDFPHYLLGCFLGWLWMRVLAKGFVRRTAITGKHPE